MKLDFISQRGETLPLINNEYFYLVNVDGQTIGLSSVSSVVNGGIDGDTITNVRAYPRSIVLDLRIRGDVENSKRQILKYIKLKQKCFLKWEQEEKTVEIAGIVESVDMPRWNNSVNMQVTIYCESPFWQDIEDVVQQINDFINFHYFTTYENDMLFFPEEGIPFGAYSTDRTKTIENKGDVSVGIEIVINAVATVTNPIIYDTYGNFFGVGYGNGDKKVVMQIGDKITITTHRGNKTVNLNGESLFGKIKPNSTWLQLETGENQLKIDSDDAAIENMVFNISFRQRYI